MGSIYAYISDCTEPDQRCVKKVPSYQLCKLTVLRSRMFSVYLGASYAGVAIGPLVSSIIARYSHDPINVFYFVVATSLLYTVLIWFVIPESVSPARMQLARKKQAERATESHSGTIKKLFQWLSPLLVLAPKRVKLSNTSSKFKRDWTLTIIGVVCGCVYILDAIGLYELQYGETKSATSACLDLTSLFF